MLTCVVLLVTVLVSGTLGLDNGLARTPPMGWTSYQTFHCETDCVQHPHHCINEQLFKTTADSLVDNGYLKSGYEYLILDDCWLARQRDGNGKLQGDPERFPSGMKALGDYIHSKGLKFGVSESYGNMTCKGYPGVLGHLQEDIDTMASWGVDYIKLGSCFAGDNSLELGFAEFGKLLLKANRPIVYSCSWPAIYDISGILVNYAIAAEQCNSWRFADDIEHSWASVSFIMQQVRSDQTKLAAAAGPGKWNDPDSIIVGIDILSLEQSKAQLAVWAITAAPLILSHDVRTESVKTRQLLQNKELIAIDQDPLGIQGRWVLTKEEIHIWTKPLKNREWAIAFVSMRDDDHEIAITLPEIEIPAEDQFKLLVLFEVFDALPRIRMPSWETLRVKVPSTGAVLFKTCRICTK